VLVLIVGFRYGSPVRGADHMSHCELENETAVQLAIPRLAFLLDESAEGPASMFLDREHGARQDEFRRRLEDSNITVAKVSSPSDLEAKLVQSLLQLASADNQERAQHGHRPSRTGHRLWTIPARLTRYTGRGALLDGLDTALRAGRNPTALTGISGSGKTATAIEYSYLRRSDLDVAWWVPADDPTQVPARLADLAHALDLAEPTDPIELCVARLLGNLTERDRWLIVFDNAENADAISRYLPTGPGQVLITSRNPEWDRSAAARLIVHQFDRVESVELLKRVTPALDNDQANSVATAVGDLPLAVDQAGSLLTDTGIDVQDYLDLLSERTAQVLSHKSAGSYPSSVAASWTVAFDRLADDDPTALELLTLVAWFGPESVPLTLITANPHVVPDTLLELANDALIRAHCTALLVRRGMATIVDRAVQVHRVPAALLRARSRESEAYPGAWCSVALRVLLAALPKDAWSNPYSWPNWQNLLPHVLDVTARESERAISGEISELIATLHDLAGTYMHARGHLRAALPLLQSAYLSRRDRLGMDHVDTMTSGSGLARLMSALGDHKQARELNEDVLLRRRRVLGEDHVDTMRSSNNLADVLATVEEQGEALKLDEDTYQRRQRAFGRNHPETLMSANNLAARLAAVGAHERAVEIDADTLARRRQVLGKDHPETLMSANNLAEGLRQQGRFDEARDLDLDTVQRYRDVLGADHPDTLTSVSNLAIDMSLLGEHENALELDEDTLARRRRVLGENHPDTLMSASYLTVDLSNLGRHERARELGEDSLSRYQDVFGQDHPATLGAASNLAHTLFSLGDYEAAAALDRDVLKRSRSLLGDQALDTLRHARNLVRDLRAANDGPAADQIAVQFEMID
jgi:tetratricopeptide (TPR) repeat protein